MKDKWYKIADKSVEFCLYGLIFFIPISKAAIGIFFTLALLFFIIKKALKPDFKFIQSKEYFFLLLFIVFSAFSLVNGGIYLKKSFIALFFKWTKYLLMFIVAEDTFYEPKRIWRALVILLFTSGLITCDSLFQLHTGTDFLRHKTLIGLSGMDAYAITSSFNHYNDLGAYLTMILMLIFGLLVSGRLNLFSKIVLSILQIFLLACLLLTFSRGAWLAFIIATISMVFLSKRISIFMIFFIIFIILLTFLPQMQERVYLIFNEGGDNTGRLILWKAAFRMIKDNPLLGKGIGTFMDYCPIYAPSNYQYAHNCYLQIWAETGIFSLISFLAFLYLLLSNAIKAFRKTGDFLLLGLICGIFGFLVHSFFDTHFYSLQLSALFWSMAGIIHSLSDKARQKENRVGSQ